ncbi:MAG: hypothetical protein JWM57_3425 [Phycisphaerales bacterium]|nr:hypothetical protein [Phycisphaerales bacterium]
MHNWFAIAVSALLAASTYLPAAPPAAETVRLAFGAAGAAIPADFVGLSFETKRMLAEPYLQGTAAPPHDVPPRLFSPTDQPLINSFKTLGIHSLRIGGNTADRSTVPLPTTADIDALFAFAKVADTKVIYTLRLNGTAPSDITAPATYIWQHYGKSLSYFEIGNEPDAYFKTYPEFQERFASFLAHLGTIVPDAPCCGPSTTQGHVDWAVGLAKDLPGSHSNLRLMTQHLYPLGDGKKATDPAAAIEALLSPDRHNGYQKLFDRFADPILKQHAAIRIEETNSYYNGGAPNASNTFASALWALDYTHWWAAHGVAGVNFHTSDFFPVTPDQKATWYVAFAATPDRHGYTAKPLAYAIAAFNAAKPSQSIPVQVEPASQTAIAAYATRTEGGDLFLTLINRSHGPTAHSVDVALPTGYVATEALPLIAASVDEQNTVILGGGAINTLGQWAGKPESIAATARPTVPAASATVLRLVEER